MPREHVGVYQATWTLELPKFPAYLD